MLKTGQPQKWPLPDRHCLWLTAGEADGVVGADEPDAVEAAPGQPFPIVVERLFWPMAPVGRLIKTAEKPPAPICRHQLGGEEMHLGVREIGQAANVFAVEMGQHNVLIFISLSGKNRFSPLITGQTMNIAFTS
jgi:hypothetical protein